MSEYGETHELPELPEGAFNPADVSMDALRRVETNDRLQLFDQVRGQLNYLRERYSTGEGAVWQTYHQVPGEELQSVWIYAKRSMNFGDTAHIIQNRESQLIDGREKLDYAEYVISMEGEKLQTTHDTAFRDPDAGIWSETNLQHCAYMQLQGQGKNIALFRGAQSWSLVPTNRNPDHDTDDQRWLDTSMTVKNELHELSELLRPLQSGTYYVEGASGIPR